MKTNWIKAVLVFIMTQLLVVSIITYLPLGNAGALLIITTYPVGMGITLQYLFK